jgi:hypothetical protein
VASILLPYEQSNGAQGDAVTLTQTFETTRNSGIATSAGSVTISIDGSSLVTPNASGVSAVATTSTGVTTINFGTFQYIWAIPWLQATGDYVITWTGQVGSVTEVYKTVVQVLAPFSATPSPGWYCTVEQYRTVCGDQVTPDNVIIPFLTMATEDIDNALIGAVYQTDANGMPGKGFIIDAFIRATARQIQWLLADNDPAGVKRMYASTSLGGVSHTRARNMTTGAFPLLAPRAAQILHSAGVLPSAALINW